MRAAVYYNNKDVRLEEVPTPEIGPGELLVKVWASGICGSDVMEWYRLHKAPLVLGHEVGCEVVRVGKGVDRYKEGDRICAAHHVPCDKCHYCLNGNHTVCDTLRQTNFDPGGFAEYIRLPAINVEKGVFPLPDEISYEEATFIEPLACVLRGQQRAGMQPGRSVLIIGSGMTGLLHLKLARALGADKVVTTDLVPYRLESALKFGADAAIYAKEDIPARLRQINEGRLADLVIVCVGAAPAIDQALQSVDRGGTILFFAPTQPGITIPVSAHELFLDNITLTTSYAGSPLDHIKALDLIHTGKVEVKDMITHRLSLEETGSGFQIVAAAQDSIKVIIEPQR